ncbi:DNA-binding MarR family transcriptional regulator [Clostridium tetanomorphum]|uniref:MarR family transcriptional regulator n=1 Tax=Clostridium tetanomorphum TaxID=1553 RepID=A0A923J2D8_CLOTT|nr:MarR family transcriptional regulator [Clostridium tetanomorphum]KAJ50162.1 regulatory protein MarR [Clostridium tetanomorphum DSM 665]MBC2399744.1 MarR family transcriptional regulator [Clostridium tetanomorphum]MBP1864276.1 DNA-binding MarR family transcriptional regulator [Clostridium tetanomorphum]NRS83723.1 DNA-binding MarR family transcriptional regulator [Clostridium tetanomorphum]NRZ96914.1 DNA-binding MarR family transcriptional regulator [Clostridium tetanomorphum]
MKKAMGRFISILYRQSQVYFNYILKEFDITSAEYSLLLYLYKKDGITQEDLSTYLYIDKSAITRAIKSLEQKGYVKRQKDDMDKRFNRVYLLDKAKLFKNEIRKRVWSWNELLTEGLDEETVDMVLLVLEKMVNKVACIDFKKEME